LPLYKKIALEFERREFDSKLTEKKKALKQLRELKNVGDLSEINERVLQYNR
jgi:hypothetical protein